MSHPSDRSAMEPSSLTSSLQSLPIDPNQVKNEKLKVTLDSPDHTYYSGQRIRGTIQINCSKPKRIRGIYFKIHGYGKCSWTDLFGRETVEKTSSSTMKYSGSEDYLNSTVYIVGAKNGSAFDIPVGTTTYDFSYELRPLLPSSFTGAYGRIKYKMEFVIDKPWKFDERHLLLLNVIQLVNLKYVPNALQPLEKQLTRTIGYIGSGPISLHVFIPKSAYVPNERMPVQLIISNNSRTSVDKVKFSIHKIVEYCSTTPAASTKREIIKILKKEAGGVHKKTEQRYEHAIDIPYLMPSDEFSPSRIINVKYEIKVDAKISGLFKNIISVGIPLIIGSVSNTGALSAAVTSPRYGVVNPTATAAVASQLPIYPSIQHANPYGFDLGRLNLDSDTDTITSRSANNIPVSPSSSMASVPSSITSSVTSPQHPREIPAASRPLNVSAVQPSAPPLEVCGISAAAAENPHSITSTRQTDIPPTYDEVFGSPSSSHHSSVYQMGTSSLNNSVNSNLGKA